MKEIKPDTPYKPVSCGLHSQYELAIMHKNKLYLSWLAEGKLVTETNHTPVDVHTKNKAEYLIAETSEHKNICIRLDHITEMRILS